MTVTAAEARELALKKLCGREPLTGDHPVRLQSDTVERLVRAQLAVDEAEELPEDDTGRAAAVEQAQRERAAAQEAVDDSTITFTFEGLAPELFDDLLEKHPPTDAEIALAETRQLPRPEYGKAFRPALIAATCTFPGFTSAEEAQQFLWGGKGRLSRTEADDLFALAMAVCGGRREVIDWGKDSARTSG